MSSREPFDRERELTESLREELRDLRRDVEAIVEREVRRAADPARIEATVRESVRREISARTPWLIANAAWVGPLAGVLVGLALGISVFALVASRRGDGSPVDSPPVAMSNPSPNGAAAAAPSASEAARDAASQAARYDSLFEARSPMFDLLIRSVDTGTTNPTVRAAIASWREGSMTPTEADRLHVAFLQLVLRDAVDLGLEIDGGILRNPCRGSTCGALLRVWQDRGERMGLPAWHAGVAEDSAAVAVVERMLVLDRLEARP